MWTILIIDLMQILTEWCHYITETNISEYIAAKYSKFFFEKQQQHKTYNSNKNFVYELKFISGHLVIRRLHFTPECRIGDPEQRRTEHSRAMLDHTGSQAVLLYSTPSTPWLQLLCPVSCVHTFMCMCVCVRIPCTLTSAVPTSMRVSRARLTSLLKPLQRDQGWAVGAQGAEPASTAASLGFGSWGWS